MGDKTTNTPGAIQAAEAKRSAKPVNTKEITMKNYVEKMKGEIEKALPSVMTAERFTRITLSALSANPQLMACTPSSFLGAMMTAAQLGVEPNTPLGQAYLIPYKNKGRDECQFQLGYKGLIDLAYRSGEISTISAHEVCENDTFEYELGLEPKLKHIPAKSGRGKTTMYYAIFKTKDGGYGFEVMSREDIEAHARKTSQAYGSAYSPWSKWFDEMAKKTVLKKCLKYAPLKSDFMRGLSNDESIKNNISADMGEVQNDFDYYDLPQTEYAEAEPAEQGVQ